jgi:Serine dehydrogenase proteinase
MPHDDDAIKTAANQLAQKHDTDVFFYNSPIHRTLDDTVISDCCKRKRRKGVTLLLVTEGGDPDAAYRIARCFQTHWEKFACIVAGYCKSSGTLILTGAHELVMSDAGELGPLDVQMTKKDELWETESGLTVMSALESLKERSFSSFEHFFLTVMRKSGNRVTFKTAAEFGVKLTVGLFTPIFQQVDPIHVGEASRAQAIGLSYGLRLSLYAKNISDSSLKSLISGYPSHGFVIDRSDERGEENVTTIDAEVPARRRPARPAADTGENLEREDVVGRPAAAS